MSSNETQAQKGDAPGGGAGSKITRCLLAVVLTCGLIVGAVLGMKRLEPRVLEGKAGPVPVAVGLVLDPAPEWMPVSLGTKVARSLLPQGAKYNDPNLTDRVFTLAKAHPLIGQVHRVSKRMSSDPRMGQVVVSAEYRRPFARVRLGDGKYAFVDREGYRLPGSFVPQLVLTVDDKSSGSSRQVCSMSRQEAPRQSRLIHYLDIEGVSSPPPRVGSLWVDPSASGPGKVMAGDLSDGLKLVEAISMRSYADQISVVDVRNYDGRISKGEPFLRLTAQAGSGSATDIRYGRLPIEGGDYEVPTEVKLRYLDGYAADHDGCIAGKNRYLDLRYDSLHVSLN